MGAGSLRFTRPCCRAARRARSPLSNRSMFYALFGKVFLPVLTCWLSGSSASAQITGPTLSALGTSATADTLAELRARVRAGETDAALAQLDALARSSVEAPVFAYLRARLYERQQQ